MSNKDPNFVSLGYKIKRGDQFSQGAISIPSWGQRAAFVKWSKKGKVWSSERLLVAHLVKAITSGLNVEDWEIVEIGERPTKGLLDWLTANDLMKIIKNTAQNK